YISVNLHHIIQNIVQIFHINNQKSSDLELAYSIILCPMSKGDYQCYHQNQNTLPH
ncbi:hypothetical protein F4604DRAFT_1588642, partial [Suillus subluteus]